MGILLPMIRLSYPTTLSSLLKGNDSLLVLGSPKAITKARLSRDLPGPVAAALTLLLSDLSPGDMGAGASALCDCKPSKVKLGLLPQSGSDHDRQAPFHHRHLH